MTKIGAYRCATVETTEMNVHHPTVETIERDETTDRLRVILMGYLLSIPNFGGCVKQLRAELYTIILIVVKLRGGAIALGANANID